MRFGSRRARLLIVSLLGALGLVAIALGMLLPVAGRPNADGRGEAQRRNAGLPPYDDASLSFVDALKPGDRVTGAYRFTDSEDDGSFIRLNFREDVSGQTASVDLLHPSQAEGLPVTRGVVVHAVPGTPLSVEDAVRELFAREPRMAPLLYPFHGDHSWNTLVENPGPLLLILWVALVLATLVLLVRAQRASPAPPMAIALLVALTGLAGFIHFRLSPHAFLHEYYHSGRIVPFAFYMEQDNVYGLSGPVVFRVSRALFGGLESAIFRGTAVLATLTIPAVVLLDRTLFGRWPRALLAGLLVCLIPVRIRFAASEELWVGGVLLACWSWAGWVFFLRTRSRLALAVAVLSLSLAMQTRSELLVLPLTHIGLLLALRPRSDWIPTLRSRPVLLGMGAVLLFVAQHVLYIYRNRSMLPHGRLPSLNGFIDAVLLFDGTSTPRVLVVCAALGAIWGLLYERRLQLWLLAALAMYIVIPLTSFTNRPCIYRTEMFSLTLAAMMAAGAPLLLQALGLQRAWIAAGGAAMIVLMAGGLATRWTFVSELLDQQQEFAFISESMPLLPPQYTLLGCFGGRVPIGHAEEDDWTDEFPEYMLPVHHQVVKEVNIMALGTATPWPAPGPDVLYYQGMDCYVGIHPGAVVDPIRPACQQVRDHYELKPISTRILRTPGYSLAVYAPGPWEIGFYEVTGLKATPRASL